MNDYEMQKNGRIVLGLLVALDQRGETEVKDICKALSIVHSLSPFQTLSLLSLLYEEGIVEGIGETLVSGITMVERVYLTDDGRKMLTQQKTLMGDPSRN